MLNEEQTLRYIRAAKAGDGAAKEALLAGNVSLLKSIVRRYLGKGVEFDDLFQLAGMGLLKAVYGFDESFGVRFSTYAVPMIAGEIKRFMRDDGSVKVSRAMKSAAKSMNKFVEEYAAEYGSQPTVREIAEKFGMEESEAVFVLGSSRMPVSIYEQGEFKDEKAAGLVDRLPSVDDTDEMIERVQLKSAIDALPEREKKDHHAPVFPRHDAERGGGNHRRFAGADFAHRKQGGFGDETFARLTRAAARKRTRGAAVPLCNRACGKHRRGGSACRRRIVQGSNVSRRGAPVRRAPFCAALRKV